MKFKLFAAVLLAVLPVGAVQAMTVEAFLLKANALEKKGMMALFSSDYKNLKKEMETAALQLRAERVAAQKAGRKLSYCPPAKIELNAKEVLTHFRAIPAAQRGRMELRDGLRSLLTRKHPCR
ncbi:MAG TPA: hypothetical protein VGB70_15160 [Allosphingosinicella sp.]|jgi:hypothetical protein